PAVGVQIAGETYRPQQRFLTDDEAFAVGAQFRRRHPYRLRLMSRVLGWDDLRSDVALRDFVHTHPFIALRPWAVTPPVRGGTSRRRAGTGRAPRQPGSARAGRTPPDPP